MMVNQGKRPSKRAEGSNVEKKHTNERLMMNRVAIVVMSFKVEVMCWRALSKIEHDRWRI
jgi:hypothetical protein